MVNGDSPAKRIGDRPSMAIVEVTSDGGGGDDDDDDRVGRNTIAEPDTNDGNTIEVTEYEDADEPDVIPNRKFRANSRDLKNGAARDPDSLMAFLPKNDHHETTDNNRGVTEINGNAKVESPMKAKASHAEIEFVSDGADEDHRVSQPASLIERFVPSCPCPCPRPHPLVLCVGLLLVLLLVVVGIAVLAGQDVLDDDDDEDDQLFNPYAVRRYVQTMTHCGIVEGVVEDRSLAFYGIPYSAPPIGPLRWKPSELVQRLEDCWPERVYKAHRPKPTCYQKPLSKPFEDVQFSEDCLYLDVYTPRVTYNDPMPVVVYFAGDSFQGHDVADFQWHPSARLARKKDVVFVVVHYRLNAFGFLALELLTKNVHPPTSGNYGLHDMLTSLKWVHRNIDGFGGDLAKVTLLGHGSGATGVVALLSSRLSRLLFNQAWITGGSVDVVNKTLREVERNNEAFNRHLICDTTECLYNKTSEQILNAIPVTEWPFWGVANHLELPTNDEHVAAITIVDGAILYETPSTVWQNNDFVDVALVVGSSQHSVASKLLDEDLGEFDWSKFNATVKSRLGTFGADVVGDALKYYYKEGTLDEHKNVDAENEGDDENEDDDHDDNDDDDDDDNNDSQQVVEAVEDESQEFAPATTPLEAYVTMAKDYSLFLILLSDLRVTCPLLNFAYQASKELTNNVYFYLSTYVPDGEVNYVKLNERRLAVHGLDVAAIFDILPSVISNPSSSDLSFQRTVQEMFYNFVERGRPLSSVQHRRATSTATGIPPEFAAARSKSNNPKMPWILNYVSDVLDSSTERYAKCDMWIKYGMYPRYGRVN